MKKLFLLLIVSVLIFSCDKPDDPVETLPTTSNSVIVKNWKLYSKYINGNENTSGDIEYWSIKSDYSITRDFIYADTTIQPNATYSETWSLANNDTELRIKLDRWVPISETDSMHIEGYEIHSVLELVSDSLILEEDLSYDNTTLIVKKTLIPN